MDANTITAARLLDAVIRKLGVGAYVSQTAIEEARAFVQQFVTDRDRIVRGRAAACCDRMAQLHKSEAERALLAAGREIRSRNPPEKH